MATPYGSQVQNVRQRAIGMQAEGAGFLTGPKNRQREGAADTQADHLEASRQGSQRLALRFRGELHLKQGESFIQNAELAACREK